MVYTIYYFCDTVVNKPDVLHESYGYRLYKRLVCWIYVDYRCRAGCCASGIMQAFLLQEIEDRAWWDLIDFIQDKWYNEPVTLGC